MKLPKFIKTNWYYINREPIAILAVIFIVISIVGITLLELIDRL